MATSKNQNPYIVNGRINLRDIIGKRDKPVRHDPAAMTSGVHINSNTEEITISTDDVIVDDSYQRGLSERWAKEIAQKFDVKKFGKPMVARRSNGKFAVIDGQHRIAALRIKWPDQRVTFTADLVTAGEGVSTEAKQFIARNSDIKKPDTGTVLHAMVREGDPDAIAFYDIVEASGYRVKRGGGRGLPHHVHPYVFKAVRKFCRDTWQQDLTDALAVLKAAWGTETFPITSAFTTGVALMFRRYRDDPRFDSSHLVNRLRRHAAPAVTAKANARAALDSTRQEYGARTILREMYNTRLAQKNQLPEF